MTMLGKYKIISLLAIVVLAGAGFTSAVPSSISNLELSRDGSFTVLTIQGSAPVQFAHQSVEAKNGKPFRIVVDCLAARHNLPQKAFENLPQSVIKAVRTSQYAVSPEEVVRVVLDLNEESVYRVEADGNNVKVLVSDQKTVPFPQWSSRKIKAPTMASATPSIKSEKPSVEKTVVKPTAEQKVVQPSVVKEQARQVAANQPKPTTTAPKKPSVVTMNKKADIPASNTSGTYRLPVYGEKINYGPYASTSPKPSAVPHAALQQTAVDDNPAEPPVPTVAQKTPAVVQKSAPQVSETEPSDDEVLADASPDQAKIPEPGVTTSKAGPDNKDVHKPSVLNSESNSSSTPKAAANNEEDVVLASTDNATEKPAAPALNENDNVDKIKTSKFRRESAKSAELKASQVVQFPQRMVIKYKTPGSRDPFASLITIDKENQGSVDLSKIPNVETLDLVGILEPESGKGAALMEDRDGIGYILRPGDKVKNGYVATVDENAVYFRINEYGWGRTIVKHMEK